MTRPPAQAGSQDLILRRPGDEGEVVGTDRDLLRIDEPETRRWRYAGKAGDPEQRQILLERLGAADHGLQAEGAGVVLCDHGRDLGERGVYDGDSARQRYDRAGNHSVLPFQVMQEEVDGYIYRGEKPLKFREVHGGVGRHRGVARDPVEGASRSVGVPRAPAPMPGNEEIEPYPRPVETAFQHLHPVPERTPRLEVACDGEPDTLRPSRFPRPRQRHAHANHVQGQAADVAVRLKHPGQEVRQLLPPVADKGVGQLDSPKLALAQPLEVLTGVALPMVVELLQHLGCEEIQNIPYALHRPQVVHLVAVDQDGYSRCMSLQVAGQRVGAHDLGVRSCRMGDRTSETHPLTLHEAPGDERLYRDSVRAQAFGESEGPQSRGGHRHPEARYDIVRDHKDLPTCVYHVWGVPTFESESKPPLKKGSCGYRSASRCSNTTRPAVASRTRSTNPLIGIG